MTSTSLMNSTPAGKPVNAYGKQRVKLSFKTDYKNVRSRPSSLSVDEGDVHSGDEVDMYLPDIADENGVTEQGVIRVWRWFEGDGWAGFVCMSGIDANPVVEIVAEPTPAPEPQPTVSIDPTVLEPVVVAPVVETLPPAPVEPPRVDSEPVPVEVPKPQEAPENVVKTTTIVITTNQDGLTRIVVTPADEQASEFFMTFMEVVQIISGTLTKWGDIKSKVLTVLPEGVQP